jgi:ribokinase
MWPRTGLHRSARRINPLASSPIIAVVGSLTHDNIFETERIPKLGESIPSTSLVTAHGGKGANIAIAAYRASHKRPKDGKVLNKSGVTDDEIRVFMNGAVGDDEHGPSLRTGMEEKGIDVTGVLTLPGERTGQVVVMVEQKEGQSISLGFKGANLLFQPRENGVECLAGDTKSKPDVLITHCTLRIETVEQMLETAYRNGVETVLSASPAVYLESATYAHIVHLVFNEHEAAEMSDRLATDFADLEVAKETAAVFVGYGVKYAIITLGEAGAVYATYDGERGHVPAEKTVDVRDTTGAG